MITRFSPKYGRPVICMGSTGPCKDTCEYCKNHPDEYFEKGQIQVAKDAIYTLKLLGYKVTPTDKLKYDFLKEII